MAASATFALKAGLCVRRARRVIVTPDMRHSGRSQADFTLIGLSEFAQPPLYGAAERKLRVSRCWSDSRFAMGSDAPARNTCCGKVSPRCRPGAGSKYV